MKAAMLTIAAAAAAIACRATTNDILDNPFVQSQVPPLSAPKVSLSTPPGFTDNLDEALAEAKATGKFVYACFSGSDWCGPCKKLADEVLARPAFLSAVTNDYALAYIDAPEDERILSERARSENRALHEKYGVRGVPTAFVMDPDGNVLGCTGYRFGGAEDYAARLLALRKMQPDGIAGLRTAWTEGKKTMSQTYQDGDMTVEVLCKGMFKDFVTGRIAPRLAKFLPKMAEILAPEGQPAPRKIRVLVGDVEDDSGDDETGTRTYRFDDANLSPEMSTDDIGVWMFFFIRIQQGYEHEGSPGCPAWAATGVADYMRWYLYEPDNRTTEPLEGDALSRKDGFQVTASFVNFVEKKCPGTVKKLHAALRAATFDDSKFWKDATGVEADELEGQWRLAVKEEIKEDQGPDAQVPPVEVTFGDCTFAVRYGTAQQLREWTDSRLLPALGEWAPKIADLLASKGWTPPKRIGVTFKTFRGNMAETPAYTAGEGYASIFLNTPWYVQERDGEAVGAAIHELVHVMQAYWTKDATNDNCPEWLSEGIADYVRWFMFEPQSGGCDYLKDAGTRATIHYNDSYRETASFLDYVEKEHPGTVKKANALMRKARFNDRLFWKEATGKTAAELEAGWKRSLGD